MEAHDEVAQLEPGWAVYQEWTPYVDDPRGGRIWTITTTHHPETGFLTKGFATVNWGRRKSDRSFGPVWDEITEDDVCADTVEPPNSRTITKFIRQLESFGAARKGRWDAEDDKIVETIFRLARTLG